MKFVALVFVLVAAFAISPSRSQTCSPWLGYCQLTDDCCRHLECLSYRARCVFVGGIFVPGEDKRPVGNGPFPPGYPTNELP